MKTTKQRTFRKPFGAERKKNDPQCSTYARKIQGYSCTPHMPKIKKTKAGPLKINQKNAKQQPKTIPPTPDFRLNVNL